MTKYDEEWRKMTEMTKITETSKLSKTHQKTIQFIQHFYFYKTHQLPQKQADGLGGISS